jgi:hypothetical protein
MMTTTGGKLLRGRRSVDHLDLATAPWTRNRFGVDVLVLGEDPVSGAITFALRCPPGLVYPEDAHFYDCDQELFQLEGEFHHDELLSFREGDYVFRPAGTVYGHGEGSEGGIIIAALGRKPVRFMFQDHPQPWTGHYRVDRLWCDRPVEPLVVRSQELAWEPSGLSPLIDIRRLRGEPGQCSAVAGASRHSPWAADAACLLRIRGGFAGELKLWPGTEVEALATAGCATIAGRAWHRGCYCFGELAGHTSVSEDLVLYLRCFTATTAAGLDYDELLARALERIHLPDPA